MCGDEGGEFIYATCLQALLRWSEIWRPAGYLSRSGQRCAAGLQVEKGTGQAHSGVSSWSSNKAACPYSPCSMRKLAKMSGDVRARAGFTFQAGRER